jgi:hypothetical protein
VFYAAIAIGLLVLVNKAFEFFSKNKYLQALFTWIGNKIDNKKKRDAD